MGTHCLKFALLAQLRLNPVWPLVPFFVSPMLLLLRTARSLRHFASASASASSWSADAAFQRLSASLGADAVSRGESVRNTHGQDQSCYPTRSPDLVVFPKNVQEVSEVSEGGREVRTLATSEDTS